MYKASLQHEIYLKEEACILIHRYYTNIISMPYRRHQSFEILIRFPYHHTSKFNSVVYLLVFNGTVNLSIDVVHLPLQ